MSTDTYTPPAHDSEVPELRSREVLLETEFKNWWYAHFLSFAKKAGLDEAERDVFLEELFIGRVDGRRKFPNAGVVFDAVMEEIRVIEDRRFLLGRAA